MRPLTSWACDVCHEQILDTGKGLVVWKSDMELGKSDFRIVHKGSCDLHRSDHTMELSQMLGGEGQAFLLGFLTSGPLRGGGGMLVADMDGFVDLFRRLQTPWYEEARLRWHDESIEDYYSDANEVWPYTPRELENAALRELPDAV